MQELDHIPIVAPVTKTAATATSASSIVADTDAACRAARTPHRGPAFVDIPLDAFGPGSIEVPPVGDEQSFRGAAPDPDAIARVAALVGASERPVLVAGGDVYWAHAEDPMRAFRVGGDRVEPPAALADDRGAWRDDIVVWWRAIASGADHPAPAAPAGKK